MKVIATILLLLISFTSIANANQYVRGHIRKNGSYVAPYVKTNPNSYVYDNYSTKGNYNPYTGKEGRVNPYKSLPSKNNNYMNQSTNYNRYSR
jgi:hypothetical protein